MTVLRHDHHGHSVGKTRFLTAQSQNFSSRVAGAPEGGAGWLEVSMGILMVRFHTFGKKLEGKAPIDLDIFL